MQYFGASATGVRRAQAKMEGTGGATYIIYMSSIGKLWGYDNFPPFLIFQI